MRRLGLFEAAGTTGGSALPSLPSCWRTDFKPALRDGNKLPSAVTQYTVSSYPCYCRQAAAEGISLLCEPKKAIRTFWIR